MGVIATLETVSTLAAITTKWSRAAAADVAFHKTWLALSIIALR